MKILITGSAGFIGYHLSLKLLNISETIIGLDNHNDYYDPNIKESRLKRLSNFKSYHHNRIDLSDKEKVDEVFAKFKPQIVINLAAQAGVRYSIENPRAYVDSNIVGFINILEGCRNFKVKHLVYASTSSVYGANTKIPFLEKDSANHPLSIYAATKKSNELMAHTYSHLYGLMTTGLRFFTVYGPWGRPDMALFKFTKSIINDEKIDVYNYGNHTRDFTYIDDVVEAIFKVVYREKNINENWNSLEPDPSSSSAPWEVFNIGNNNPIKLMDYINYLEKALNKKAKINFLPLQAGDVPDTNASNDKLYECFKFKPKTLPQDGIKKFVEWYLNFYK